MYVVLSYILLFLIICIIYACFLNNEYSYVISSVNNKSYLVKNGNLQSANVLATLDEKIIILLSHLKELYEKDRLKYYFYPILNSKFKQNGILSEAVYHNTLTTYTVDKKEINVCLKTRDSRQKLYDIDLLMYVLLHELGHLCNYHPETNKPIIGHGESFVYIFKTLIRTAIDANLYSYTDYSVNPKEYCGILLTSSII